jgi:hypothetical protein
MSDTSKEECTDCGAPVDWELELAAAKVELKEKEESHARMLAAYIDEADVAHAKADAAKADAERLRSVVQSVAVTGFHKLPGGDECICIRCELVREARAALTKEKS